MLATCYYQQVAGLETSDLLPEQKPQRPRRDGANTPLLLPPMDDYVLPALPDDWHWPEVKHLLRTWVNDYIKDDKNQHIYYQEFIARQAANWQLKQVLSSLRIYLSTSQSQGIIENITKALRPARRVTADEALVAIVSLMRETNSTDSDCAETICLFIRQHSQQEQKSND